MSFKIIMMSLDLLFLVFIVFFAIVGYIRGFLNQVLSIAMIITVILFAKPLADWLKYDSGWKWISHSASIVLWATSAFLIFVAFIGLGALIRAIKKSPGLTPVDRWVGMSFGMLKGFLLVLLLGCLFLTLPEEHRAQFKDMNSDSKDSIFLGMSKGMMGWKSVSLFDSLGEISHKLEPQQVETEIMNDLSGFTEEPIIDLPTKRSTSKQAHPRPWGKNSAQSN